MKVVIPLAGKGTRLRPHTHTVPKPLLEVAGKPVLDHVVHDALGSLDLDQLIFITGHLKEQVEEHVRARYSIPAVFVEQKVQDGTAGAVKLAEPYVDGPLLIVFVDTLFEADLTVIDRRQDVDGLIWAKEVEDYQRFGVIVTDSEGLMKRIVEKPKEPVSRLANIGLYYIRNHELLFEGINAALAGDPYLGEFFLTDAFQYMVDHGARIGVPEVGGWYDCGKPETLLATNLHLLSTGRARRPTDPGNNRIEDPVRIEDDVELIDSRIGPNVSIASGCRIVGSKLANCIVASDSVIENSELRDSLIGSRVAVRRFRGRALLGDDDDLAVSGGEGSTG